MEFGVNTKFVLGLPRAKQLGLEHCKKNLRDCDHHRRPPPPSPLLGMIMITDSMVIFLMASLSV